MGCFSTHSNKHFGLKMRIGRLNQPQEFVFSLEKIQPSSSSSSFTSSSSSSGGSVGFNSSITTELALNPEIPDYYYAEAVGISLVSITQEITLSYDNLNVSGPAFIMDIQIGSEIVASVTVAFGVGSQLYLGKPFSITYEGVTYNGVFTNGTVVF